MADTDFEASLNHAQAVKQRHEAQLLTKKNVVGVGVGFKQRGGQMTDAVAIIVNVQKKVPKSQLSPQDLIPEHLEGVPLDVVEVGSISAI
jgi:hypothetical protein